MCQDSKINWMQPKELIKKRCRFFFALESINEYFQNLYYLKGNSLDEKKFWSNLKIEIIILQR